MGQCNLFEGSGQYDRLNKILGEVVLHYKYNDTSTALGISPSDFGTHSLRKGTVTHISTGTTSCPPIASICLHANWALPGVMGQYIKYENAGHQFVGKCVSGLPRLTLDFAASPAYFDFSAFTRTEQEERNHKINGWIKSRMPLEAQSNDKVFSLFKMCIASIGYHCQFLEENLHSHSSLRTSIFMLESMPFKDCVTMKLPWNSTTETPDFTGIPPDILVLAKLENMKLQLEALQASLSASFEATLRKELANRNVHGPDNVNMMEINKQQAELMKLVKSTHDDLHRSGDDDGDIDVSYGDGGDGFIELYHDESGDTIDIPGLIGEGASDQLIRAHTKKQLKRRGFTVGFIITSSTSLHQCGDIQRV